MQALGSDLDLPQERILCSSTQLSLVDSLAFEGREVSKMVLRGDQRRLDVAWANKSTPPRWITLPEQWSRWFRGLGDEVLRWERASSNVAVFDRDIDLRGVEGLAGIRYRDTTFFLGQDPTTHWIKERLKADIDAGAFTERVPPVVGVLILVACRLAGRTSPDQLERQARLILSLAQQHIPMSGTTREDWQSTLTDPSLLSTLGQTEWTLFDPLAWERRDMSAS